MRRSIRLLAICAIVTTLGLFWEKANSQTRTQTQPPAQRNPYTCPGGKTYPVHLTFDDGPHPENTVKVLKTLQEERVPATFFVLGEKFSEMNPRASKKNYEILDKIRSQGHVIASHSFSHVRHSELTAAQVKKYVEQSRWVLRDYFPAGQDKYFRLPYGDGSFAIRDRPADRARSQSVMSEIQKGEFVHAGWDIDTNDWDARKRSTLVRDMMKQICANRGGVILMHDVQHYTAEHLQEWIEIIREAGHSFVTLDDIRKMKATHAVGNQITLVNAPESPRPRSDRQSCPDCPVRNRERNHTQPSVTLQRLHEDTKKGLERLDSKNKRKKRESKE